MTNLKLKAVARPLIVKLDPASFLQQRAKLPLIEKEDWGHSAMASDHLYSLQGKRALITGGGTGIGLAISRFFVEAGANIVITGRREEPLRKTCEELGAKAQYRVNDIAQTATLPALVDELENSGFVIDILVNNAGICTKRPSLDVSDEEFSAIVQTNLTGLFALTREVARRMVARKQGSILNISSITGIYGVTKVAAYGASKAGLIGLTRTLASEFGPSQVRVNAISPGPIYTDMTDRGFSDEPERRQRFIDRTPLGRMGNPDEVAAAAVFLSSEAASFITGVNLPVDGGNSISF
jgi:NAD(P)-dependent dehydrogenase (short-subunit alcohol dehydrogenase family)